MSDPVPAVTAPSLVPSVQGERLGLPAIALLLAVSAAVLVPGMAGVSLFDRDEGWYAQVSREMVESGDWLVPRLYGEVWIAKPPLLYWLVATSYKLFGIGEWQTRLVPVLATAINVLLVAKLGAMMFSRRVGVLAGILFVTSGVMATMGKLLLTDWVMLACTLSAVCLHWRMATDRVTHLRAAGYWLAIGLSVLAKGPAILLFSGVFAMILMATRDRRGWLRNRCWWMWLPLALIVATPWFVYIHLKAEPVLAGQFLWHENVSRVVGTPKSLHPAPPGYHLLLSFGFWLPWTVFIPGALVGAFRAWRSDPSARVLLLWAAVPWVILELVPSKLLWYVLPCYVPLAVLLAKHMSIWLCADSGGDSVRGDWADREFHRAFRFWPLIMIGVGAAGIVTGLVGSVVEAWWWDRHWSHAAIGTCAVLVVGFEIVRRLRRRSTSMRPAFIAGLLTTFVCYATAGAWLLPKFEPMRLSRQVGETIATQARPDDCVCICGYTEPTAHFYLRSHSAASVEPDELATALAADPGPILLAITQERLDHLEPSVWKGWQRQPLGRVDGRNYSWGFRPETIRLERLVRVPAEPETPARDSHPQ